MKRILMVCESFGGGVFAYVSQLCNDMCRHFDVTLAYAVRPQTPSDYRDKLDDRVRLIEVEGFSSERITNLRNDKRVIESLRVIARDVNPDVIHLHSSVAGALGRIAYRKLPVPVVYTPHGYAHVLMGSGPKSVAYRLVEQALGRIGNTVTLTCCESEDEEARRLCRRTAWIETGVNLAELSEALDEVAPVRKKRFTVFSLGRACIQKQPALFNEIATLVPEADFVWVGGGELEDELNAPNVRVTGWMPRNEALALAKGADAYILCSLGEAIAMSLLENMYLRKLVLVSDVMGNRSVIQDGINGYVCDTASDYATRIQSAMRQFPSSLPERAYQDVLEIYNTKAMSEKYELFYETIGAGA